MCFPRDLIKREELDEHEIQRTLYLSPLLFGGKGKNF
jgi:hypothetical protein